MSRRRVGPAGSRAGLRRPGTLLGLASGSGSLLGLALSALARPLRAAPGNPPPARPVPAIVRGLLRTARPPPGQTRPSEYDSRVAAAYLGSHKRTMPVHPITPRHQQPHGERAPRGRHPARRRRAEQVRDVDDQEERHQAPQRQAPGAVERPRGPRVEPQTGARTAATRRPSSPRGSSRDRGPRGCFPPPPSAACRAGASRRRGPSG